jgi:hypothetical protein
VRVALLLDQRKAVRDDIVQMICNMQNMRNTTRNQPTKTCRCSNARSSLLSAELRRKSRARWQGLAAVTAYRRAQALRKNLPAIL